MRILFVQGWKEETDLYFDRKYYILCVGRLAAHADCAWKWTDRFFYDIED